MSSIKSPSRLAYLMAVLPVLYGATLTVTATAQDSEQPGLVLRENISTIDAHEALIADLVFPANKGLPRHQHPGDEFLYMLEGQVELKRDDRETILLSAGQGHRISAGTVHSALAGAEGARAIIFRVHPQGEAVTNLIEEQ